MTVRSIEKPRYPIKPDTFVVEKSLPDKEEHGDHFLTASADPQAPKRQPPSPWKSCAEYKEQIEGENVTYRELLVQFKPETVDQMMRHLAVTDRNITIFEEFQCKATAAWDYAGTLGPLRERQLKRDVLQAYLRVAELACGYAGFFGERLNDPRFMAHAEFDQLISLLNAVEFWLALGTQALDSRDMDDKEGKEFEHDIASMRQRCYAQAYTLAIEKVVDRRIETARVHQYTERRMETRLTEAEIGTMLTHIERWAEQGNIPSGQYEKDRAIVARKLSHAMQEFAK